MPLLSQQLPPPQLQQRVTILPARKVETKTPQP